MLVSVKNKYFRFIFELVDFNNSLKVNSSGAFSVKILRETLTRTIDQGMECIVWKNRKSLMQGTVTAIKPAKDFLVLTCTTRRGK
jgi:hypothetical protein